MSDPGSTYRTRDEINTMRQERDPIERVKKLLLKHGQWNEESEGVEVGRDDGSGGGGRGSKRVSLTAPLILHPPTDLARSSRADLSHKCFTSPDPPNHLSSLLSDRSTQVWRLPS
jgi:hypothetical protein